MEALIKQCIVENYQQYYRLAYSYVHNEQDAMDIVQEGAYRAIYYSHTLKKEEFVRTWVYRIMINEALNFLKKNKKDKVDIDKVTEGREDTYEDIDLKRALELLGEPEGTIVRLRFFEDMKLEQIAQVLDQNVNTVKTRLYRSLKALKLTMEEK
jgi:RNA polymerase sigma-70 factor (ECF subfamily)